MIDVLAVERFRRDIYAALSKILVVERGDALAFVGPLGNMLELDAEHRTLNRIHAVVEPVPDVIVLAGLSPVSELPDRRCKVRPVRHDGAALSTCAKIFSRIEAEAADVSKGPGAPAAQIRSVGLRGILDHRNPVALGYGENGPHVRQATVEMDWHDRLGSRRDGTLQCGRLHGPAH